MHIRNKFFKTKAFTIQISSYERVFNWIVLLLVVAKNKEFNTDNARTNEIYRDLVTVYVINYIVLLMVINVTDCVESNVEEDIYRHGKHVNRSKC